MGEVTNVFIACGERILSVRECLDRLLLCVMGFADGAGEIGATGKAMMDARLAVLLCACALLNDCLFAGLTGGVDFGSLMMEARFEMDADLDATLPCFFALNDLSFGR